MKKEELKQVIEIEGVRLTKNALKEVFHLQHGLFGDYSDVPSSQYRFNNEGADMEIEYLNRDIHYLLEQIVNDPEKKEPIVDILTTLNRYKQLLDLLKCPEKSLS